MSKTKHPDVRKTEGALVTAKLHVVPAHAPKSNILDPTHPTDKQDTWRDMEGRRKSVTNLQEGLAEIAKVGDVGSDVDTFQMRQRAVSAVSRTFYTSQSLLDKSRLTATSSARSPHAFNRHRCKS